MDDDSGSTVASALCQALLGRPNTVEIARTLSQFLLFSGIDDPTRQQIAACVHVCSFAPGQMIALTGEPVQAAQLVVDGRARAYRLSPLGREWTSHFVAPGGSLDLGPLFDGGFHWATVEAVTPTTVYAIPGERFREIVRDHPEVARAVLGCLADTVRTLSDTAENLALYTVRARLARFLVSCADDDARLATRWTQEEIASRLGTVRDVIGRTLRSFSKEGLIRRERGRLVVTDLAGVRREAMSNAS